MKKTSLYLDDGDVERVRRLAQREGRSQADVVRAALAAYESQLLAQRRFSLTGSAEGDGAGASALARPVPSWPTWPNDVSRSTG